jgi:hypothetical protein
MKKFSFLIPVALAAASLSGEVAAKAADTATTADAYKAAPATAASLPAGVSKSLYTKDGDLHSLMMRPTTVGTLLAWHGSHASHASHRSHYSHRSAS